MADLTIRGQGLWRHLTGQRQHIDETGLVTEIGSEVTLTDEVIHRVTPDWEQLEPMEAIQRVHQLLDEERNRLLQRIRESELERNQLISKEAEARAKGDDAVRSGVMQLALGGLAQEA